MYVDNTTDRTAEHNDTIVKRGYVEEAIKEYLIHLRVKADCVQEINDHFEATEEMEAEDTGSLLEWRCSDNDHIAELKKIFRIGLNTLSDHMRTATE